MRISSYIRVFVLFGTLVAATQTARAQTFTGSSNQGDGTSTASVAFSVISGCGTHDCLKVVLTNTSTYANYHNPSVLDGVFFDITGGTSTSLSAWSAITPTTLFNAGNCTGGPASCTGTNINVGHEWGYQFSSTGYSNSALTTTARYGVGAAGFSMLSGWGSPAQFNGAGTPPNLGPTGGSVGFGIVGSAYTGGSGTAGSAPLDKASVTFDFQLPTGVTSVSISNVTFAYGTNPDGSTGGTKTPEPASLTLLGCGVAALAFLRRRKGVTPGAALPR